MEDIQNKIRGGNFLGDIVLIGVLCGMSYCVNLKSDKLEEQVISKDNLQHSQVGDLMSKFDVDLDLNSKNLTCSYTIPTDLKNKNFVYGQYNPTFITYGSKKFNVENSTIYTRELETHCLNEIKMEFDKLI